MVFRKIYVIAANQIQRYSLGDERCRQAEYIGPVTTARKQRHRNVAGSVERASVRQACGVSALRIILTDFKTLFHAAANLSSRISQMA